MKIRKGDTVKVIAGKDKGKVGTILTAFPKLNKVIIEGVNVAKRSVKKDRSTKTPGQIIEKSRPIDVSNVSLLEGDKAVRAGFIFEGEGREQKKVRVARPSGKKL